MIPAYIRTCFLFVLFFCAKAASAQTTIETKNHGTLEFTELDHGVAEVTEGKVGKQKQSPTGVHAWLKDFAITKVTDSVRLIKKANFGVVYIVKAKDNVDINVEIEWIYPAEVINDKGEHFTTLRYATKRPTNIESASSYSLDEPYEMLSGNWTMNIYIDKQKVCTRTFVLY